MFTFGGGGIQDFTLLDLFTDVEAKDISLESDFIGRLNIQYDRANGSTRCGRFRYAACRLRERDLRFPAGKIVDFPKEIFNFDILEFEYVEHPNLEILVEFFKFVKVSCFLY